jgi:YfiH family protein
MDRKASPAVSTGFRFDMSPAGRALRSEAFAPIADHLFTTRQLQFREATLAGDYERLAVAFACSSDAIVSVRQVHGRTVLVVRPTEPLPPMPEADAIISTDPCRVISVRVADCVPILIADRRGRAVAAIHAGWRGTAAGVTTAAVEALADLGVAAADLAIAIGPSIGPCCYQVDDAVREAFVSGDATACFAPDGPGHWRLDLAQANRQQLIAAGVVPSAVSMAEACTSHRSDDWFSYRREGRDAGRMVAAIRLRSPVAVGTAAMPTSGL